jgi:hypothetical protein
VDLASLPELIAPSRSASLAKRSRIQHLVPLSTNQVRARAK